MILLILGVLLWIASHLLKRLAPELRASLGDARGKIMVTLGTALAIALMVIGFRSADPVFLYDLGPGARHLNNLLMVLGFAFLMASTTKSRLQLFFRHPMLLGVVLWSIAHLLVAGDLRATILFGGLGVWAIVQMLAINRAVPVAETPDGTPRGDLVLLAVTIALVAVASGLHIWAGLHPFGAA